ncbi:MAG: S8 family serine peptidase [Bdellovibrionales bacterium]|nr:S8 family serine peptidase [Bdellovibrionales bacterium]
MIARKITLASALIAALALSLTANAESKRYLVQFKNTNTYKSVAKTVNSNMLVAPGVMAPLRLFNSDAVVAGALNNVELLVIESTDSRAVESLKQHPAIALVEEEIFHPAPRTIATFGGADILNAKPTVMARPWGIDAVKAPAAWNTTKGSGVRVMVLDTGIETAHPAMLTRFEKGQNFTSPNKGDMVDTIGHGTHVAGTILADGLNGGLVGVAPEARLLMGKVCSDVGCSSIAIASGIDWAVTEKADVVNMSLGGMFISNGEAQALLKAEAAGVMVVAASGNGGMNTVSYPAAFKTVLAVGAVDSTLTKADFSQWGPELAVVAPGVDVLSSLPLGAGRAGNVMLDSGSGMTEVKSAPFQGSPVASVANTEMVFAGLGKPEDFARISVSGKIALIGRGEITFKDKVANAIKAGVAGVIIFNNAPGLLQGALTEDGSEVAVPAAMIEQKEGEAMKAALISGANVRGTVEVVRTDYGSLQGTSMATPHVAGVAALVRAANRSLTPEQVREILKSTATPLGPNNENQYGSGLVNAEAAVAKATSMFVGVQQAAN